MDLFHFFFQHCELKKQSATHVEVLVYLIHLMSVIPSGSPSDISKAQLENDLKMTKTSTRLNKSVPLEFVDIRDLTDDPGSIGKAISNLSWSYSNNYDAVKSIYMYSLDCTRKAAQKDE